MNSLGGKMNPSNHKIDEIDDELSKKVLKYVDGYMEWWPDRDKWIERKLHDENYQAPLIEFIESSQSTLVGKKVLNIGSGMGGFETILALREVSITGLEPSYIQMEITKLRLRKYGAQANLIEGKAERLPIKDNVFDIICLWAVIEHVKDPPQTLREVYRVLKPGGRVFMTFCNKWTISKEEHYFLRFITWVPRGIAVRYIKFRKRMPGSETYQGISFKDMHYYSVPRFENLVFHIGFKQIKGPCVPQKYKRQSNYLRRLVAHIEIKIAELLKRKILKSDCSMSVVRTFFLIALNIRRTSIFCELQK